MAWSSGRASIHRPECGSVVPYRWRTEARCLGAGRPERLPGDLPGRLSHGRATVSPAQGAPEGAAGNSLALLPRPTLYPVSGVQRGTSSLVAARASGATMGVLSSFLDSPTSRHRRLTIGHNATKLLLLKYQAVPESTTVALCSLNCYRQSSSVRGHDTTGLLDNLTVLFPRVVKCVASNLRGSRHILHTLSSRHGNFFPVRPGQRCLERLTVCINQIQFACAIGCER